MSNKITGGPAFPATIAPTGKDGCVGRPTTVTGLTIRDWFAGQALNGMLADVPSSMYGLDWDKNVVHASYKMADLMLAERTK